MNVVKGLGPAPVPVIGFAFEWQRKEGSSKGFGCAAPVGWWY